MMPYIRKGTKIYKKLDSKLQLKQTCSSVANAKGALRLLRGIEHGMVPRKRRK